MGISSSSSSIINHNHNHNNTKRLNLTIILTRGLLIVLFLYVVCIIQFQFVFSNNNNNSSSNNDSNNNNNNGSQGTDGGDGATTIIIDSSTNHKSVTTKKKMMMMEETTKPTSIPNHHKSMIIPPFDYCHFRNYPSRRYYGLRPITEYSLLLPDFLQTAEYIYGKLPILLIRPKRDNIISNDIPKDDNDNDDTTTTIPPKKLCVNQSEWYPTLPIDTSSSERQRLLLPFADGTNPSLLKFKDNRRINASIRQQLLFPIPEAYYLSTIGMTNSQCAWRETIEEQKEYRLSTLTMPSTIRTILLVLNKQFETIQQATIVTVMDGPYGKRRKQAQMDAEGNYVHQIFALDDARLFTYQGEIWISYREGKLFGYDQQVLNKLHFVSSSSSSTTTTTTSSSTTTTTTTTTFSVHLLASDTETLCCGRNMALIDNVHTNQLQALTWVDPVTVEIVEMKMNSKNTTLSTNQETTSLQQPQQPQERRRLLGERRRKKTRKKSHFHGTNGFMVHLPHSQEYLGIGHFHRPHDRQTNEYARFGHHYTHAFFTINDNGPPYHLQRLSQELVLPSHANPNDAEIIQFWSGLELLGGNDNTTTTLGITYGINDCEGAVTTVELSMVEDLLQNVERGKEVVDLMMPLLPLTKKKE